MCLGFKELCAQFEPHRFVLGLQCSAPWQCGVTLCEPRSLALGLQGAVPDVLGLHESTVGLQGSPLGESVRLEHLGDGRGAAEICLGSQCSAPWQCPVTLCERRNGALGLQNVVPWSTLGNAF